MIKRLTFIICASLCGVAHSADEIKSYPSIKDCQSYGDTLVEKSGESLAEIGESPVDIRRTVEYYCMLGFRAASQAKSSKEIDLWRVASLRDFSGVSVERDKYKAQVINAVSDMAKSFYEGKKSSEQN